MPKKKINSGVAPSTSNINKRMTKYFPDGYRDIFFQPLFGKSSTINNDCYIHDEDAENKLTLLKNANKDLFSLFIGYQGIGKSTVLKHCFSYEEKQCLLSDSSLLFTKFSWDYYSLADHLDKITELFHNLCSLLATKEELNSHTHKLFLLKILRINHTELIEQGHLEETSLDRFKQLNSRIFEIRQFQYLLLKNRLQEFTIVLDNIEDIPGNERSKLIHQIIDAYMMLHDWNGFNGSTFPNIKLLISLRPETYLSLNEHIDFNKYPVDYYINKVSVPNMDKYFSLKIRSLPKNKIDYWANSVPYFIKVSQKFGGKYNQIILGLSNYNVNYAMRLYADILSNETWLHGFGSSERSTSPSTFFDTSCIYVNNITIIRSLGCLEDEMYLDQSDRPFCNLLHSTPDEDYSIIMLYLMNRFYSISNSISDYGKVYLKKRDVLKQFSEIFYGIENIWQKTDYCIHYLFDAGILAKSLKTTPLESHKLKNKSRLYMTPRGITIWEMLSKDSVLLEMFREDYYRDYQENDNNPYCSMTLMDGQQHELFLDLLRVIDQIAEYEHYYNDVAKKNDTANSLKVAFGAQSICQHLLSGVYNSMMYSGIINNPIVKQSYDSLMVKLTEVVAF